MLLAYALYISNLFNPITDSIKTIQKQNIISVTFGGRENFGFINYERIFSISKKLNFSYNIGIQPFNYKEKFSLPFALSAFTKGRLHHLELMINGNFHVNKYHPWNGGWGNDFSKQLFLTPFACYRLQKNKGIVFKNGVGPQWLIDPPSDNIFKVNTMYMNLAVFGSLGYFF